MIIIVKFKKCTKLQIQLTKGAVAESIGCLTERFSIYNFLDTKE
jgi:hypothetical protein